MGVAQGVDRVAILSKADIVGVRSWLLHHVGHRRGHHRNRVPGVHRLLVQPDDGRSEERGDIVLPGEQDLLLAQVGRIDVASPGSG